MLPFEQFTLPEEVAVVEGIVKQFVEGRVGDIKLKASRILQETFESAMSL